jgi:hypothetical protein
MQAQQAILTFDEAERSLGARLLKIAVEIDRIEGYSEPHAIAIAWTAERIGARMGLHGVDLTALKFAALAHDLGERAMKRNYLLRPDELSWDETLDLWRHPILGEQAAGELKLPRQTQLLIRWHHEWWNGGGYPDGLAGEVIPPGARILRAVDSYFALISDRPHRRRFDRTEAEQIIADLAGIEFDPQVVKLLLQVLAEEAAGESAFAYPAPGGDEALARLVEDQPQPLDEVVYASAYARPLAEIPAEPSGGDQGAAPDFAPSRAPDGAVDEAVIESRPEMAGVDFASSEAADEVEGETRTEMAAADFASPDTIEEAGIEARTEMAGADPASSETPDEAMVKGRMEMVRADLASPNMLGGAEVESRTDMTTADFISSETLGKAGGEARMEMAGADFASSEGLVDFASSEGLDKTGVEAQTEMADAETQITQEKLES